MQISWKWAIPIGCVILLLCGICVAGIALVYFYQEQILATLVPTQEGPPLLPTRQSQDETETPTYDMGDIQALIQKLNGQPCAEDPDLTCVTLTLPLDHSDTSNTKTVDVVFAIHPATGERKGMFFQAFPGGPGGEGISTAYLDLFDEKVLESYDIVYFDQRGVGLSSPLVCPTALAAYYGDPSQDDTEGTEGFDTPAEQEEFTTQAKTFVDDCVKEMGIPPEELQFYSTKQVAEDIESFREAVGAEKFYMYGVSYGTSVAQTYTAAHADRLAGLILDGTVDLTLAGNESLHAQEKAFEKALLATLDACKSDDACMEAFGGDDPQQVYDDLATSLAQTAQTYAYPMPDGTTATHPFTFSKLEAVASYQMYSLASRMLFLRALAAAHQGDLIPLARLYYAQFKYDPVSEVYIGDPDFSDPAYYFVNCADESYFTGTPEERAAKIFEDGQASNGTEPRLDGNIYTGMICAYWPSAPQTEVRAEPLTAEGIPTLVLNATLDPATPFEQGRAVYQRLADGYHLYVEGGQHSILGYDETCPDAYVTDFLISGQLPSEREIECKWDEPITWSYIPRIPADASQISDPSQLFSFVDIEVIFAPEHLYNSEESKDISVACPYGGSYSFILENDKETFTFTQCELSSGLVLTGIGDVDTNTWTRSYTLEIEGIKEGTLTYTYDAEIGQVTLQGTYDGEDIDLTW